MAKNPDTFKNTPRGVFKNSGRTLEIPGFPGSSRVTKWLGKFTNKLVRGSLVSLQDKTYYDLYY